MSSGWPRSRRQREPVYTIPSQYPSGYHVAPHQHSRAQFVYARTGVVMVSSRQGRWMVPPEHALWIPAKLDHSVDMLGEVTMLSAYISSEALTALPEVIRVVALTDLARALIVEAVSPAGRRRKFAASQADHGVDAGGDIAAAGSAAGAANPVGYEACHALPGVSGKPDGAASYR
jgi:hypothetical protein